MNDDDTGNTFLRVQAILTTAITSYLLWTAFTNTKRAQRAKRDTRVDDTTLAILAMPKRTNPHKRRKRRVPRTRERLNYEDIA